MERINWLRKNFNINPVLDINFRTFANLHLKIYTVLAELKTIDVDIYEKYKK